MVETEMIEYTLHGPASQERARIRVMSALRENRFPQAILIDGPAGIGKKWLAMEIAKALQCTDPNMRPCGHCFGCRMAEDSGATDGWVVPMEADEARARSSDDVAPGSKAKTIEDFKKAYIEEIQKNPYRVDIFSTGAYISVDLIRSMTSSFAMKGDRIRTIVIAEADRMNESAANDDEVRSEVLRVAGEEFDETSLTDDVIGLAVGSPGKALYYAEHAKYWCKLASDFVIHSLRGNYTELFMQLKDTTLDEAYDANRFLEVLSFLLADLLREQAGARLRMPETTTAVGLSNYPRVDATALELALVAVQETMSRIESRRVSASMCLQNLSLKLFEGYK